MPHVIGVYGIAVFHTTYFDAISESAYLEGVALFYMLKGAEDYCEHS